MFDRLVSFVSRIGAILAAMALAMVAISVIWEVIARSLFSSPTIWANEVATYGVTLSAFLGAAYVLRHGGHLEIDLVTSHLTARMRRGLGFMTDLTSLIFCIVGTYLGVKYVNISWIIGAVSISELRVPMWIPQLSIPIAFAMLALEFMVRLGVRLGVIERAAAIRVNAEEALL